MTDDGASRRPDVEMDARDLMTGEKTTPAWLAAKVEARCVQIAQIEAAERAKRAEG